LRLLQVEVRSYAAEFAGWERYPRQNQSLNQNRCPIRYLARHDRGVCDLRYRFAQGPSIRCRCSEKSADPVAAVEVLPGQDLGWFVQVQLLPVRAIVAMLTGHPLHLRLVVRPVRPQRPQRLNLLRVGFPKPARKQIPLRSSQGRLLFRSS